MIEFELQGQTYRIGKLDAFKQWHVSRRIAPIVPTLIPIFMEISKGSKDIPSISELLQPLADCLAGMSDEQSEYVIATCLSVAQRKSGSNWAAVWNKGANACMFDDMDLSVIIQIVIKVVQDSLGPFIQGLLMSQQGSPMASNG